MTNLQPSDDNMKDRINNLFSGQDLPSYANIREVESMKARIQDLESQLARQNAAADSSAEKIPMKEDSASGPTGGGDLPGDFPRSRRFGWLSDIWDKLTKAHSDITETTARNSARLAASFLFIILLLLLMGGLVRALQVGILDAYSGPFGVSMLATMFAYGLVRTRRYQVGIFVFSLTFSFLAYLSIISEGANADISSQILVYVPLSLIVASTFLNSWAVFLLTGLNIGAFLLTTRFGIQYTPDNFGAQAGIVTTIGLVLIALANFRRQNERQQIDVLRKINQELDDANRNLEERVADRTHDLELASEVGKAIAARVDNLYQLLSEAVELVRARFNLYYTQVYLTDQTGRFILLRAGTGDVGKQLLQRGHQLPVSINSLNGQAALEKHPVIVADTLNSSTFLPNPLLPKTRSEMSIPLIVGNRVVGVLDVQSEHPNAFNESNLPAFEALAGQLAVAVQNASLFEEVNQARSELEEQAKRRSHADWVNFLNAVERSEKTSYIFNQIEVIPYVNLQEDISELNSLHAPISVAGVEIGKIHIVDSPERKWTPTEADIIDNTATQLSRHIENLRLLAQSEKYRLNAEEASKRLTREGWQEYLQSRKEMAHGYIYNQNQVQPLQDNKNGKEAVYVHPIHVREELIGELAVDVSKSAESNASELLSAVAQQLSNHIENLRLLEQTEISRVESQKSQEQYALAVQGANDGIWDWDIANESIYYSARWKSMLGYEEHELTRGFVEWEELIHPEDKAYATKALTDYLEQRAPEYNVEIRLRHKDGTYRWINDRGKALRHADGTPYRMAGSHTDITERKLAEETIRRNEARLAEALEIAHLGNWEYDFEKDLFFFNDAFYSVFRTSIDAVGSYQMSSAEYAQRFVHPDDAALVGEEIGKVLSSTERNFSKQLEHRIIFSDGSIGHILVNIHVERDENGKIIRWHGANQDITERKLAEEAIRKAQEQYALAVDGSNDGLWDWNIETNEVYFSPRWKAMVGYSSDELMNGFADFEALLHPDDHGRVLGVISEYLAGKIDDYNIEFRFQHKDGTYRWILARGKAMRRGDGTPYRMAGSHTDITERKQAEELIAQRANQLETVATVSTTTSTVLNPDELLQTVVDLTKERFGLYHAHIYIADEAWDTLLLTAGAGEVGRNMVTTGHAINISTEQSLVARAYRERKAVIVNDIHVDEGFLPNPMLPETHAEMAVPMIVGDKVLGVFDLQSEKAGEFTEEDALIYNTLASQVAIALQNARLYQEQSATVTQLRELDRLKSSFLANMSHELRTPLNSILGFADVMLEGLDGPLTDYMDNDLRLIQKNGQHLLHLINDVLDMAKIESGRMNLHPETFVVHDIMEEVTSITSSLANDKNLALYIEPDSDREVQIIADRTRLRQVMINLVNNAIKFTENGHVSIQVEKTDEENILIAVHDTGLGIPQDQLDEIFNEFTQVDTSTTRKAGGTGLGLPISRRLVEMHGGKLWADSTGIEGHGSTFYVKLPIEARIAEVEKQEKI